MRPPLPAPTPLSLAALQGALGDTDIYLVDQLLKGRILPHMRILDAGCGAGRNLRFLLQAGMEVYGADRDGGAIAHVREWAKTLAPLLPDTNFRQEAVEDLSFGKEYFDFLISSAVLHFAEDEDHFGRMVNKMWEVLKPGGVFFCRLASSMGLEDRLRHLQGRHFLLPDGSTRFLVDDGFLLQHTARLQARQIEPIKTVNVQHLRCMTTWCLQKPEN